MPLLPFRPSKYWLMPLLKILVNRTYSLVISCGFLQHPLFILDEGHREFIVESVEEEHGIIKRKHVLLERGDDLRLVVLGEQLQVLESGSGRQRSLRRI